jgi:uncharacterized protein (TIGR01589 family)
VGVNVFFLFPLKSVLGVLL